MLHCIKAEFVGVLEMGGFGVLPGRLATQLTKLILEGVAPEGDLAAFSDWMCDFGVALDPACRDICNSQSVTQALYASLCCIIEDNSAFSSRDLSMAQHWFDTSLQAVASSGV